MVHRSYVGKQERGESGVTVDSLAAILAALDVSPYEFFGPFKDVVRPRTPVPPSPLNSLARWCFSGIP
jgi:transcriptional regulator with XRE-family HTH domain